MKYVVETWDKGKLVSREEKDDGMPDIQDIEKRLKVVEKKVTAIPVPVKE